MTRLDLYARVAAMALPAVRVILLASAVLNAPPAEHIDVTISFVGELSGVGLKYAVVSAVSCEMPPNICPVPIVRHASPPRRRPTLEPRRAA